MSSAFFLITQLILLRSFVFHFVFFIPTLQLWLLLLLLPSNNLRLHISRHKSMDKPRAAPPWRHFIKLLLNPGSCALSFFYRSLYRFPCCSSQWEKVCPKSCYCSPHAPAPLGRTCLLNAKFMGAARFFFTTSYTKTQNHLGSRGVCDLFPANRGVQQHLHT